jgi:hypothetical protein
MPRVDFAQKWTAPRRHGAGSRTWSIFIDMCNLLGQPTPNSAPTGERYALASGATNTSEGDGWADVWLRHHFGWEYKGKRKDLESDEQTLEQLLDLKLERDAV